MSKLLQLRGGTTAEHASFTGAVREVTVDTTKKTLVVHDGATAGGFVVAPTDAEIRTSVEAATDSNVFTDADHTKLNAIEASADVTDTVNVVAALTAGSNITIASDGTIAGAAQYTHPTHDGDDAAIDTGALSGATVISDLDLNITTDTLGHVTDANATVSTRNLTLGNLGFTGATNANYITNNNQLTNGAGYVTTAGASSINGLSDGYVSSSNPATNTNPTLGALWLNSTTGQTFVCKDATTNSNVWANVGEQPVNWVPPQYPAASGGTVSTHGNFKRHVFTSSGNFSITMGGSFNLLIISGGGAGGGGGGSKMGGGGGAGGRLLRLSEQFSTSTVAVIVSAGMAASTTPPATAANSAVGSITSIGGGMGGYAVVSSSLKNPGSSGGSGGGGSYDANNGGTGTLNQGNDGGKSVDDVGGGGGGAGAAGTDGTGGSGAAGVSGGAGLAASGNGFPTTVYAGGGGGGSRTTTGGAGGSGGGGRGGGATNGTTGNNANANTGSGGGGGGVSTTGGSGGSGIVIITYQFQ